MSSRQSMRSNQGITRNIRPNANSRLSQKRISNNGAVKNTTPSTAPSTASNSNSIKSDEAIKINKILNLLNERLKALETKTQEPATVETNVSFDNNISLSKMNTLFSLMYNRIASLENHNKLSDLNVDLKQSEGNNEDNTNDVDTLINNNKKILAIENKLLSVDQAINNININGISNNFVKLNNLIQTTKNEVNQELTTLKEQIKQTIVVAEETNDAAVDAATVDAATEETNNDAATLDVVAEETNDATVDAAVDAAEETTSENKTKSLDVSGIMEEDESENIKMSLQDDNNA